MGKLAVVLVLLSINGVVRNGESSSGEEAAARGIFIIFVASYLDAGNNNYINTTSMDKADFWPYGETYFRRPTGRFSDGRLISDFIAEHANLPLIPPYLLPGRNPINPDLKRMNNSHGVNFASAGAGALSLTFQGMVIDLRTQGQYYEEEVAKLRYKMGDDGAAAVSSSAVYMFSIGTNDYISPFLLNSNVLSSYTPSKYVDMVIGNLTVVLKTIYKNGGRKFVFLNLGDLGCLPGLRILKPGTDVDNNGGCLKEASDLAKLHNTALNKMLSRMEQRLHGFKYFIYDFNNSLAQMTASPHKYGFKQGIRACCGSGNLNGVFSCGGKRMVKEFEV